VKGAGLLSIIMTTLLSRWIAHVYVSMSLYSNHDDMLCGWLSELTLSLDRFLGGFFTARMVACRRLLRSPPCSLLATSQPSRASAGGRGDH
jgi:hypothetical protein